MSDTIPTISTHPNILRFLPKSRMKRLPFLFLSVMTPARLRPRLLMNGKGFGYIHGKRCQYGIYRIFKIPLHVFDLLFVERGVFKYRNTSRCQSRSEIICTNYETRTGLLMQFFTTSPKLLSKLDNHNGSKSRPSRGKAVNGSRIQKFRRRFFLRESNQLYPESLASLCFGTTLSNRQRSPIC